MNVNQKHNISFKKTNISTASEIWSLTKIVSKFLWCGTKFVVKNTPAAIGMAWEMKKEISNTIAQDIHNFQQAQKKLALEEQIAQLKKNQKPSFDCIIGKNRINLQIKEMEE